MDAHEAILKTLWEAQLHHWPKSIRLTPGEVLDWAYNNLPRCNSVLMSLQHPAGVWYRIPYSYPTLDNGPDIKGDYRGFRFGIQGHEYLSF